MRFSLSTLCGVVRTIHMGLWVLWTEIRWLLGADLTYRGRLEALRHRQSVVQSALACMVTLVDPRHKQLAADLALLEEDLTRLEAAQEAQRKALHQTLCARFAEC
ncbi:MAG: hypothetical protein RRY20_09045 [Bilophila sp.]